MHGSEIVPPSQRDRATITARSGKRRKSPRRSRMTNGSFPVVVDERLAWARRVKDLIALHSNDLGGEDAISEAERSIIRRCAVLTTQLERLEVKFAQADGDASVKDVDLYQRTAGNLRRLFAAIGVHRRQRDVTPSLGTLIARDQQFERERLAQERAQRQHEDGS
jgi:hypothetical protein